MVRKLDGAVTKIHDKRSRRPACFITTCGPTHRPKNGIHYERNNVGAHSPSPSVDIRGHGRPPVKVRPKLCHVHDTILLPILHHLSILAVARGKVCLRSGRLEKCARFSLPGSRKSPGTRGISRQLGRFAMQSAMALR